MKTVTDWASLWKQLVESRRGRRTKHTKGADEWVDRAAEFNAKVENRWRRPDSSRDCVLSHLRPSDRVLDIGAGTGAWAILMAPRVSHVTAVEPSPAMASFLRQNTEAQGVDNVSILEEAWPCASVERHDVSLCAHAMYMSSDLPEFVRAMNRWTARTCFLLMRAPILSGVMAEACQRIWGHPHDSPNFVIAYNVLMDMGIYANVLMEDTGDWGACKNASLDEALFELKRKLGIAGPSEHDDYLLGLLRKRLTQDDGVYVWPPSMRSALVYWHVND